MTVLRLVVHHTQERARRTAERLEAIARALGLEVADAAGEAPTDMVVALGGDGTMLRAARVALAHDVPLRGVNLGWRGFLSTVDGPELEAAVRAVAEHRYSIAPRMTLEAATPDGAGGGPRAELGAELGMELGAELGGRTMADPVVALNEIAFEKAVPGRVIEVRVMVGDEELATFRADGVMVATPTGSTAYSYSAGGPVLEPGMEALVVTAVAPHTPPARSVVVGVDRPVTLTAVGGQAALSADGLMIFPVPPGVSVSVRRHAHPLKLVRLDGTGFFERLRTHLFASVARGVGRPSE